jgi:CelD/BcsL family acetyltransferase involved in cellulose biosynthesis
MRIELTDDASVFRSRDWTRVVGADRSGTLFHTPPYLDLWWQEFGSGSLRVALAVEEETVVGACCFEVGGGTLRFLGGLDVTDYMGPVALPGFEDAVAKELMTAVAADVDWERADLRGLPMDSPWYVRLQETAASQDLRVEEATDGVAPLIDLPATFEQYLAGLPGKLRHEIRRKERRLRGEVGDYRIRTSTPATLGPDLARFIELHRASRGPKGRFMDAGMERFFRRLGEEFVPRGLMRVVSIEFQGVTAGVAVAFIWERDFLLYNQAFDRAYARLGPGMALVANLIWQAIREGRPRFDMLKGDLEYKYRFGARPRSIGSLLLTRLG